MDKREKKQTAGNAVEYIKKYADSNEKELKYDFMPKILEIIERPANKAGTVIIFGILTHFVTAIV